MKDLETRYLERLSDLYPTIAAASTEIINLQAILQSSQGNRARGRELYDVLESYVRKGFFALDKKERQDGRDIMWYIWLHPGFTIVWKE